MIKYLNTNLATKYIRKNSKKHSYISNTILIITPHILFYTNFNFNYSKINKSQIVQLKGSYSSGLKILYKSIPTSLNVYLGYQPVLKIHNP